MGYNADLIFRPQHRSPGMHMNLSSSREELKRRLRELEQEYEKRRAAETALRQSEKRLLQIIQAISIPMFVIDTQHRIVHCNKAYENLTGISAQEMIGTRRQWEAFYDHERPVLADFVVDEAGEKELDRYYGGKYHPSAVVEGGYEAEDFFPAIGKDGKWLFFTAAPLRDEDGRTVGAIETLQDITERRKAEEALRKSEQRLRTLLDFVPYPIVVFTRNGRVFYLNPAFTHTFGWTLQELQGRKIPYIPPDLEKEAEGIVRELLGKRVLSRRETKRLTKDGRTLDVVMRGAVFYDQRDEPAGELFLLRDITEEKRIQRNNEALLRMSTALPEHPDLEDLLDYVSAEIKRLLNSEGALVVLHDEKSRDLYFLGAAYDDPSTQQRVKEARFSLDQLVAGKVIQTGKPLIISEPSEDPALHEARDRKLGYRTRNLLLVPLRSSERIIGALAAINKKDGDFQEADQEMLDLVAGTVSLSVENARFSEEVKRAYRNTEALLRISRALPEYPELEDLLDYVSQEIKRLLDAEGALVILHDEENEELFFLGAAYDDAATQRRVKEFRFPLDELVAGKVIRTGRPVMVLDPSEDPKLHLARDRKLGYHTRNLLLVPLRSSDRIIGVLAAINKKGGDFQRRDEELLNMLAGTVALSIENAWFSQEMKKAYLEVSEMNRAKGKAIHHLSHELKTPLSVLMGSLDILERRLEELPEEKWKPTMVRARRNLNRITAIQEEAHDIMGNRPYPAHEVLTTILTECADELEVLIAREIGEGGVIREVRKRIEEIYGISERLPEQIRLQEFVPERVKVLDPAIRNRRVKLILDMKETPPVYMPPEDLQKVVDGLIKNAVENTPDGGKVEVSSRKEADGTLFTVRDYGTGITEENQKRIFDGFFATQETLQYSSKRPFDFNAGGKGADLLRMKVFSERYGFHIKMSSIRCPHIPYATDTCPGDIKACEHCAREEDCFLSGGTVFTLYFPPPAEDGKEAAGAA